MNLRDTPMLFEALETAQLEYRQRHSQSAACWRKAAACMPGGNTRSVLWMAPFPLYMASGAGCRLTDVDGHEYVDFLGEFTAGIFGHSPQQLKDAIVAELERGLNRSAHNPLESELAAELCARFPSMEAVRFTNSGTEANLMAIAAARRHTGRSAILVFEGAYHGSGLAFTADERNSNIPFDFVVACYNDIEGSRALIRANAARLAAVLVEPMLGAGGCIPGDPQLFAMLREETRKAAALLIFDEIQTSRLSVSGRQGLLGVVPDLTTLGKFYGGGLPFGCFGGRRDIMKIFDPRDPASIPHSGTFNNNGLTLAAALAGILDLLTPTALDDLNRRGERMRGKLGALLEGTPYRVSGLGSLMNIHACHKGEIGRALQHLLYFDMLRVGFYFAARGLIALSLPILDSDVDRFLAVMQDMLARRRPIWQSLRR